MQIALLLMTEDIEDMIKDKYKEGKTVFSIEVFPPKKTNDIEPLYKTLDEFQTLTPAFISVTYGAGGSTSGLTAEIATYIKKNCNIEALSHLTCASLKSEAELLNYINLLKAGEVHNILALRGDKPKDMSEDEFAKRFYAHASDLVPAIRNNGDFSIAGACYPEKHPMAATLEEDIANLKIKVDNGVDFLITQLFYDNDAFYRFIDKIRDKGIDVPVSAGLMPITAPSQVNNIIALSDCSVPKQLQQIIDKYIDKPEDLKKAGLEYTKQQMEDLIQHQVDGIHIYSMNKVEIAKALLC